jgi:exodeoxyribonuclease V alpha subunit
LGLDVSLVEKAYQAEIESTTSSIVDDKGVAWLKYLYVAEEKIAKKLKKMISGKPSWTNIDIQESIAWVQFETGSVLAEQQKKAIEIQLSSRVMIVTGGPGCGKTFLLNSMLKILRGHGVNCLLTAPTGKAAVRMRESTGLRAKTIHRLLRLGKETSSNEVLDCDLLVIDEFSMVDVSLFVKVLEALPPHASILMVGDADQLPSVGAGATLWDMIASKAVPVVKLDKVFRQAEHSKIIQNAHKVNAGSMVSFGKPGEDFFFMSENDAEKIPGIIESLVAERLPARFGYDPVRDIQILCPSHRSSTGTVAMNALIQNRLNPNPVAEHTHFGIRYGVGDKVMQRVNNYDKDVFNGDAGVVIDIDVEASSAYVKFANESIVEYDFDELDELVLASAMTIHKSQGSDFPVVIIPVTTQHFMMLQRNLIYTGITRARKLCIIVGQQQALEMAIRNNKAVERITRLFGLLKVVEN